MLTYPTSSLCRSSKPSWFSKQTPCTSRRSVKSRQISRSIHSSEPDPSSNSSSPSLAAALGELRDHLIQKEASKQKPRASSTFWYSSNQLFPNQTPQEPINAASFLTKHQNTHSDQEKIDISRPEEADKQEKLSHLSDLVAPLPPVPSSVLNGELHHYMVKKIEPPSDYDINGLLSYYESLVSQRISPTENVSAAILKSVQSYPEEFFQWASKQITDKSRVRQLWALNILDCLARIRDHRTHDLWQKLRDLEDVQLTITNFIELCNFYGPEKQKRTIRKVSQNHILNDIQKSTTQSNEPIRIDFIRTKPQHVEPPLKLSKEDRHAELQAVLKRAQQTGNPVIIMTSWHHVIQSLLQRNKIAEAERELATLQRIGISPALQTLQLFIEAYSKDPQMVEKVNAIHTHIKRLNLHPDIQTYNTIVSCYGLSNRFRKMDSILIEMTKTHLTPESLAKESNTSENSKHSQKSNSNKSKISNSTHTSTDSISSASNASHHSTESTDLESSAVSTNHLGKSPDPSTTADLSDLLKTNVNNQALDESTVFQEYQESVKRQQKSKVFRTPEIRKLSSLRIGELPIGHDDDLVDDDLSDLNSIGFPFMSYAASFSSDDSARSDPTASLTLPISSHAQLSTKELRAQIIQTWSRAIYSMIKLGSIRKAVALVEEMEFLGLEVNDRICTEFMYHCGQAKNFRSLQYWWLKLNSLKETEITKKHFLMYMRELLKMNRVNEARKVMNVLTEKYGHSDDTYALWIRYYTMKGLTLSVEHTLRRMELHKVSYGVYTISALMEMYAKLGDIPSMFQWFDQLKIRKPDEFTVDNVLAKCINIFGKAKNPLTDTKVWLDQLEDRKDRYPRFLAALMVTLGVQGRYRTLQQHTDDFIEVVCPEVLIGLLRAHAYMPSNAKRDQTVVEVLQRFSTIRNQISARQYEIVAECLYTLELPVMVLDWIDTMIQDKDTVFEPTGKTLDLVAKSALELRAYDRLLEMFLKCFETSGIAPDKDTIKEVISKVCATRDWNKVQELLIPLIELYSHNPIEFLELLENELILAGRQIPRDLPKPSTFYSHPNTIDISIYIKRMLKIQ